MKKKSFIPNWYEDKKNEIRYKKIKIFVMLVSIVNILLLSFIFNISKEVKNIDGEKGGENINISVIETVKKDIIIIEKYKELSNFFEINNFCYKNIMITKDNLEIEIEVNDYEEYINVIRRIEDHYSIKNLIPNIKSEGNINFKVIL